MYLSWYDYLLKYPDVGNSWRPKGVLTGWFPIFRMWCLFQVPDRCLELWYLHGSQQHAEVCSICDWYLIVCFCVNISLIIIGLTITSEFRWMEGRMEMDGWRWIWMDGDGWMEMDGWRWMDGWIEGWIVKLYYLWICGCNCYSVCIKLYH